MTKDQEISIKISKIFNNKKSKTLRILMSESFIISLYTLVGRFYLFTIRNSKNVVDKILLIL